MNKKWIFILSGVGVVAGCVAAYLFGIQPKALPPAFQPATNPYAQGIYANGMVESYQANGVNMSLYPEVAGRVVAIHVHEGQTVHAGDALLSLEDSVQRATASQQQAQAEAAGAQLAEIKAQPRPETLAVYKAQLDAAQASLKTAQDEYDKQKRSYSIDSRSVSRDALDSAENAMKVARANRDEAQRQYDLTRAGDWSYDIENQDKQYRALLQASQASNALLAKYTITAPADGVILSINAGLGDYVSASGVYDPYTQGSNPVIMMGETQDYLGVRAYIDEILVSRLPAPDHIQAQMSVRGSDVKIPLEFVRVQPYISTKIELSDQRQERVDLRVLPVIFRFAKSADTNIYPGQLAFPRCIRPTAGRSNTSRRRALRSPTFSSNPRAPRRYRPSSGRWKSSATPR
jgi:HlyD family secretion protein